MRKKPSISESGIDALREQALTDAAQSVKSIRKQNEAEPENNYVINALKNSEEAMFFLACNAANDDEDRTGSLLSSHGLDDIR